MTNSRTQPKTVIEEARVASGLGQAEMAALAGTSQPTLSRTNGERRCQDSQSQNGL